MTAPSTSRLLTRRGWRRPALPAPPPAAPPAAQAQLRAVDAPTGGDPLDVFLVGSAYSGTTYLGGLLEENLGSVYAGELGRLPGFVDRYRVFPDSVGCLLCAPAGRVCPTWTPHLLAEAQAGSAAQAMARLRAATGARVVVDGSKMPQWLRVNAGDRSGSTARLAVILTARSPLSYTLSAVGATGEPIWEAAAHWRDVYTDALRAISGLQLPFIVVRNEEVRRDPAGVLDRLAPLLGSQRRFTTARPARATHSIGGNVFVQHGYTKSAVDALAAVGLVRGVTDAWDAPVTAPARREESAGELQRPRDRQTALGWAQSVLDTPGLVGVAQSLGYTMAVEVDKFVAAAVRADQKSA